MFNWVKAFLSHGENDGGAKTAAAVAATSAVVVASPESKTAQAGGDACFAAHDWNGAAMAYREALAAGCRDVKLLNNLGFALSELGKLADAEACLTDSLSLKPEQAETHYLLGTIAAAQANEAGTIRHYRETLRIDPTFEFAYRGLCQLLLASGDREGARKILSAAIEHCPGNSDFHFYLGNIHYAEKQWAEAIASFSAALAGESQDPAVWINLSLALQEESRFDEALTAIDRALQIDASIADWHVKRGHVLQLRGDQQAALDANRHALSLEPDFALALANIGALLEGRGELSEALEYYRRAQVLIPDSADACFNVGSAYQALGYGEEALRYYRRAIKIDPRHLKALSNMAVIASFQKRHDEALALYNTILIDHPESVGVHMNKAYLLWRMGRLEEAWQEHEYRWHGADSPALPEFTQPLWLGKENLSGKTILLYGEQGFGDNLQFVRYAKMVAQLGARVYLLVRRPLKSLMAGCEGVAAVFAEGDVIPPFDFLCPLMSLPLACKTSLQNLPADTPYLHPTGERVAAWRTKLGAPTALRVGLVWAGDPRKGRFQTDSLDHKRSMKFEQLLPLLALPAVEFFSLQLGARALGAAQANPRVLDFTAELSDFQETAALIANLDLVISVDTSVAHLAGGLNKPVWLMDRYDHCYRWLPDREDSPWYPTMHIFRQTQEDKWEDVVTRIKQALEDKSLQYLRL